MQKITAFPANEGEKGRFKRKRTIRPGVCSTNQLHLPGIWCEPVCIDRHYIT
jgi:hypothetical protein